MRSLRPILGQGYHKDRAREKEERKKGCVRDYEEKTRKQISKCTKIHREREFKAHAYSFIKKKMYPQHVGFYFWVDSVFQGSEAKRELKCFHCSGISSLLVWVEVSCSAKEHLMSKSTDDYLVNRLSFSPCPCETPQVTKVVKWRNNICCYCRRGSEKRRGEVKSENKLCPISKSHRKSTSQ